jgi:hypothetical protein
LGSGSPCIDTGEIGTPLLLSDLRGVIRPQGARADMGAFESGAPAPTAVCMGIDLVLNPTTATLTPAAVTDPSSTVPGGLWKATINNVETMNFDCNGVGPQTIALKLTDLQGQSGTCNATVNVVDNIPPEAVCKDITVVLPTGTANQSTATIAPRDVDGGSLDNCAINWAASTVVRDDAVLPANAFTCADAGQTIPVTLTVIDFGGNSSTGIANVSVVDTQKPAAAVRPAVNLFLNAQGSHQLLPADVDLGSTDNCPPIKTVPQRIFTCGDAGQTFPVTLTVQDSTGNTDSAVSNVTIGDNSPPIVTVRTGFTLYLDDNGNGTLAAASIDNGSHDNCGIKSMTLSRTAFTCLDRGVKSVTLTVLDNFGNTASASTFITIRDGGAPAITLKPLTQPHVDGEHTSPILWKTGTAYTDPGATALDICEGAISVVTDASAVNVNVAGEYTVVYTATDSSGNSGTATRTVQVVDHFPPIMALNGASLDVAECGEPYVDPGVTAIDETGASLTVTTPKLDTSKTGSPTLVYDTTDQWGGTAEITRTVNVVDRTKPVITIPTRNPLYILQNHEYLEYGCIAMDACAGNLSANVVSSATTDPPNTAVLGHYQVTYTVNDSPDILHITGNDAIPAVRDVYVIEGMAISTPQGACKYINSPAFDLSATITGGGGYVSYQWYRGTTALGVQPMTTAPLTVTTAVDPATLGVGAFSYHVEATDSMGKKVSGAATVTVANHLSVGHMLNLTGAVGQSVCIRATVTGGVAPLTYSWTKNGAPIAGDTAELCFTLAADSFGDYQVTVSDACSDTVPSNVVTLGQVAATPLTGGLGIALLTALTALGGAFTLRRKR